MCWYCLTCLFLSWCEWLGSDVMLRDVTMESILARNTLLQLWVSLAPVGLLSVCETARVAYFRMCNGDDDN